ncbi:hypothetical protein [Companilactobacillus zhongbaensis]|uniref:hypothetical protein n=1 Tax=Companilactobacillus zhongbaensis TaxID=2486009 RepID=UPI000F785A31|nr:hypothetical protein [Companilactobacillus zhongbaensis]
MSGIEVYDIINLVRLLSDSIQRIDGERISYENKQEPAILLAEEIRIVAPQLVTLTNVIEDKLTDTHGRIYDMVNEELKNSKKEENV